jgi:CHAD domain-containing protein
MVVIAESDEPEGPHQLRVGLRRLRTAFGVFGPSLGENSLARLSSEARGLGQVVGPLRDFDVLIGEIVLETSLLGLDAEAHDTLVGVLESERGRIRAEVCRKLAHPRAVAFLFDLGELIEGRGWLLPSDYSQTERLAAPVRDLAGGLLDARLRKVRRSGRKIRKLDADGLHELRKELKKLRYAAELFEPVFSGEKVASYIRELKSLQDRFGSLSDAAMATAALIGPQAPGRDLPAAQRGIGWVLGVLEVQVRDDRPEIFERWDRFRAARPFWA